MRLALLGAVAGGFLVACSQESAPAPDLPPAVVAGRQVYQTNCTACHNANPNDAGALGPAVAGSSLGLLEAKVLRGEYPPGYTPKRDTRAMVPLPFLKSRLPDLEAYLAWSAQDGRS